MAGEHEPDPPLGWYDDPLGLGLRFWDGAAWTEFVASAPVTIEPQPPVGDLDLLTPDVVNDERPSGQSGATPPSEAGAHSQTGLSRQLATTDVAERLDVAEPGSGAWRATDGDPSQTAWSPAYTNGVHADHEPSTLGVTSGADALVAAGWLPASDERMSHDAESTSTSTSTTVSPSAALSPLTEAPETLASGGSVAPSRPKGHERWRSENGVTRRPLQQSVRAVGLDPIAVRAPLEAGEVAFAEFRAHRMARVGRTAAHAKNGPVRRIDKGRMVFTDRRLLFIGRRRLRFVGRRTAMSVPFETLEVAETTFVKQVIGTRLFLHCPQMRDGEFFGLRGPGNRDAFSSYLKIVQSRAEAPPSTNGAVPAQLDGVSPGPLPDVAAPRRRHTSSGRVVRTVAITVVLAVAIVVAAIIVFRRDTVVATPRATTSATKASGPSGQLMPSRAPRGYHAVVAQDFAGTTVPSG
ncbi:MAG TPA: DUF2510 domain-containing protein, partial [Acidimicrobiales bacterium]|nr:DUF2510 domain-containing protein [Acidimicrobiales bacterium]